MITFIMVITSSDKVFADDKDARFYLKGNIAMTGLRTDDRYDRPASFPNRTPIEYDDGDGVTAAIGMHFDVFRVELEYLSFSNDISSEEMANAESVDATGPFFNIVYTFPFDSRLRPYFGGGFGYINVETEVASESDFSIQYLAGLDLTISDNFTVDLGVRYVPGARYRDLDPVNLGGSDNAGFIVNYDAYAATLGLRLSF